jgi:hypothetical protein
MSILCSLYRLTAEQAAKLQTFPDGVGDLLGYPATPPKLGLISKKIFGRSPKVVSPPERRFEPIGENDTLELNQAWHILHYLYSGSDAEGEWPSAFIMSGGQEVGPDLGYGPPRLFLPEPSRQIATFLEAQSFQALDAAYVTQEIETAKIYWKASSEPTERKLQVEELWGITQELRAFFAQVVSAGHATLIDVY